MGELRPGGHSPVYPHGSAFGSFQGQPTSFLKPLYIVLGGIKGGARTGRGRRVHRLRCHDGHHRSVGGRHGIAGHAGPAYAKTTRREMTKRYNLRRRHPGHPDSALHHDGRLWRLDRTQGNHRRQPVCRSHLTGNASGRTLFSVHFDLRCNINPAVGPARFPRRRPGNSWSAAQKWAMTLKSLIPPLALILAVMGTILGGVATPTEAGGHGCCRCGPILAAFQPTRLTWPVTPGLGLLCHPENHPPWLMMLFVGGKFFSSVFPEHGRRRRCCRCPHRFGTQPLDRPRHHDGHRFYHGHVHRLGSNPYWLPYRFLCPSCMELDFNPRCGFRLLMCVNLQTSFSDAALSAMPCFTSSRCGTAKSYTMMHIYTGASFRFVSPAARSVC